MTRFIKLSKLLGIGLAIAFTPSAAWAQMGAAPTPVTTPATPTSPTQPSSNQGGGGANGQPPQAVVELTTKHVTYAAKSGTASATTIPSNANAFAATMVIPQSLGLPDLYKANFGPQNAITQSGGPTGKYTYLYVAPATAAAATTPTQTPTGFSTYGTPRAPVYTTHLSDDLPPVAHQTSSLYVAAKEIIDTSNRFRDRVKVTLEGDTIVLAGVVNTANERVLAEGVIRTAPGVNGMPIRNELVVAAPK